MSTTATTDDDVKTGLSPASIAALLCGGIFTVGWLVAAWFFLHAQKPECWYGLDCIGSVNDWGDFLAGTFSPLAFVWLVVAVFLQSMELKEQRHELALTRLEFSQNRAVAQAQADESKRQAEFIGEQTKLLQEQERRFKAEGSDAIFDAAVEILAASLINYDHIWKFRIAGTELYMALNFNLQAYRSDSDRRIVIGAGQELRTALRRAKEMGTLKKGIVADYPLDFVRTYRAVLLAVEALDDLDSRSRSLAQSLELNVLQRNMQMLIVSDAKLARVLNDSPANDLEAI